MRGGSDIVDKLTLVVHLSKAIVDPICDRYCNNVSFRGSNLNKASRIYLPI